MWPFSGFEPLVEIDEYEVKAEIVDDDDYDYDQEDIIIVDYYYHAIIIQPKWGWYADLFHVKYDDNEVMPT